MNSTKEINLFDLCAHIGHKIVSGIKSLINGIGYAIRLTYRQWWIVLIVLSIAVGLGLYYSRENNRIYKVDAVAVLNGVAKDIVSQEFTALAKTYYKFNHQNLATILSISPEMANKNHSFKELCLNNWTSNCYKRLVGKHWSTLRNGPNITLKLKIS